MNENKDAIYPIKFQDAFQRLKESRKDCNFYVQQSAYGYAVYRRTDDKFFGYLIPQTVTDNIYHFDPNIQPIPHALLIEFKDLINQIIALVEVNDAAKLIDMVTAYSKEVNGDYEMHYNSDLESYTLQSFTSGFHYRSPSVTVSITFENSMTGWVVTTDDKLDKNTMRLVSIILEYLHKIR